MGERTSHPPGTFSWIDLATSDDQAATEFYSGLFGWEGEATPIGDGTSYTMFKRDGRDVSALTPMREEERAMGIPPHWNSYVSVEDADAAAARAAELGGTVMGEVFDVMDAGRMAVVQDPTGAFVMLWQPARHIGAGVVNDDGALAWNELATSDPERALEFYSELFGWTSERDDSGPGPYWTVSNGGQLNGGVRGLMEQEAGVPPHWMPYFGATSSDATASRAKELGGNVLMGPMQIPMGKIAVVQDPQGATFALFEGDMQP